MRSQLDENKRNKAAAGMSMLNVIFSKLEFVAVVALQVLVILLVVIAAVVLYVLLVKNLLGQMARIGSANELLPVMQQSFAGILTVLLGLELLETLKAYFTEHHIRLEVILVVAIIAVGRHVLQLNFEQTPGGVLLGLSAVIVALTMGYFLVKKSQVPIVPGKVPSETLQIEE